MSIRADRRIVAAALALAIAAAPIAARQRNYQGSMGYDWYKADGTEKTRYDDTRFVVGFALVNPLQPTLFGCAGVVIADEDDKIKANRFRVQAGLQPNSSLRAEFPRQTVRYQRQSGIEDEIRLLMPGFNKQIHAAYAMLERTRAGDSVDDLVQLTNGMFFDSVIDNKLKLRRGNKYAGGCRLGSPYHDDLLIESAQAGHRLMKRELILDLLRQILPGVPVPERDQGPRVR